MSRSCDNAPEGLLGYRPKVTESQRISSELLVELVKCNPSLRDEILSFDANLLIGFLVSSSAVRSEEYTYL